MRLHSRCANPLQSAIHSFLSEYQGIVLEVELAASDIPKRYTRYGVLLLLGPTFTTHSPAWHRLYERLDVEAKSALFQCVLNAFPGNVTHLAVNSPIAATAADDASGTQIANVMRSPTGFLPLHGEFGPSQLLDRNASGPSAQDFEQAFWTETTQLQGIVQTWAPRWTMFSRGNISEKARILQEGKNPSPFPGLSSAELATATGAMDVVDFYVGIGYFALCYLSRGVRRLWGWDINGWSIEGLRRACIKNGWGVKIVKIDQDGNFDDARGAAGLVADIQERETNPDSIRCIAFWGDNTWATRIMKQVNEAFIASGHRNGLNVRHCNLGLLPTSQACWADALAVVDPITGGWLHVHENVDMASIKAKETQVIHDVRELLQLPHRKRWQVVCEHIENVKTYAPGIMHCVFDIKVGPRPENRV